mgnify:FL=1
MKMKLYNKKIITGLAILAMLAISCGKKKTQAIDNSRPVKVQIIGQNSISLGYKASGTLKGIEEVPYTATSSGEIVVINAKNGDSVSAGQVIVAIDNQAARSGVREAVSNVRTAESNISSAHGDISAAKGNIASAEAAVEEARINYQKYKMLYDKRLITETDFLTAQTKLSSAQANLNSARSNYNTAVNALSSRRNSLSSAQANLATANDTNSKTVIKTKVSGYIANMDLERHQQVSAGAKLFTLVNESEMKLEIGVPAEIVKKIQMGAQATIKVDELNGKEIVGTVYEIAASADSASRQFIVKVKFPNPDRELKSGMYGKANIATGAEDGLIIPKKAIVVRGVQQVIYVIRDGKAVMIPINISNQNETYAAVTGDGLTAGDQLVVDGQNVVQANEKVNIVQ